MTQLPNPKGVSQLKELLFDRETRRLEDIDRRVVAEAAEAARRHAELLRQQSEQDRKQTESEQRQKVLSEQISAVFDRAGTTDKLQHSVAEIIDGALREAEVARHDQLSRAIAPLIIRTIKVQLRDSQDEMVEALYPITGRLVQSYVQSAMNEMMAKINAKLGGGVAAELTAQSDATGISAGELAMAEANKLEVEELFLVRRGTGELVAHWERPNTVGRGNTPGGQSRDQLFSSYLTGIMSLSEETFGDTPGSFRTLSLTNGDRIFVRGSAAHLLAVRCSGTGGPSVERVIDEVFLQTIERYQQALAEDDRVLKSAATGVAVPDHHGETGVEALLPQVGLSIEKMTAERRAALLAEQTKANAERQPSFGRLYAMAAMLAAPFIIWGTWSGYQSWETTRTENAVKRVLAATDELHGVPPRVEVERGGRSMTVSGFVPAEHIKTQVLARLALEAPKVKIRDQLGVLPSGAGPAEIAVAELRRELSTEFQRVDLTRPIERTRTRISQLKTDIARVTGLAEGQDRIALDGILRSLDEAGHGAARARTILQDGNHVATNLREPLTLVWQKLTQSEAQLATVLGMSQTASTPRPQVSAQAQPPTQLDVLAEDIAMASERMSVAQLALAQALALKSVPQRLGGVGASVSSVNDKVSGLSERLDRLRLPTPREDFEALVRSSAVFFENGTDLRDPTLAQSIVDKIARQMRELPNVIIRVAGYTDERGTQATNSGLAQQRADRVATLLAERGVPANRIVSVGRLTGKDLSRTVGPTSANRRVEFEIGFPGEVSGAP